MSIDHLTDRQMQSYVDNESIHNKAEIAKHLASCKQCQKQFNAYKFVLSGMLQGPQDALFSEGFENALMGRILRPVAFSFQIKDYLVATFTSVIVMALLCYPFLIEQIRALITDSYIESWNLLKETSIEVFCNGEINSNCMAIPAAVLIVILAFKILEKMYIQPRLKITQDSA
jgi:hypothetical protein